MTDKILIKDVALFFHSFGDMAKVIGYTRQALSYNYRNYTYITNKEHIDKFKEEIKKRKPKIKEMQDAYDRIFTE